MPSLSGSPSVEPYADMKATTMVQKKHDPNHRPSVITVWLCLLTLAVLFVISSAYKTEIPLPIYAIIAGILFGAGNINKVIGGGK